MEDYFPLLLSTEEAFIELLHHKEYTIAAGISDALHKHYFKVLFERKAIAISTVNTYLTQAGFKIKKKDLWEVKVSALRLQMRIDAEKFRKR